MTAPLLLVGHGTVDAVGVAEFGAFTRRLGRRLSDVGVDVDGGFIELSSPTVHEAWAALAARGTGRWPPCRSCWWPRATPRGTSRPRCSARCAATPATQYRFGRPLGPHPVLQEMLVERVAEALGGAAGADTAVLLVGRGSTDPDANAEVCKVARLLQEGGRTTSSSPRSSRSPLPDVAGGLARCREAGRAADRRRAVLPVRRGAAAPGR